MNNKFSVVAIATASLTVAICQSVAAQTSRGENPTYQSIQLKPLSGLSQGLSLTQTGSGGSNNGTLYNLNNFHIIDELNDISIGVNIFYGLAGTSWQNPKTAVSVFANMSTNPAGPGSFANDNMTALALSAEGSATITNSYNDNIGIFGINPYVWLGAGATGYYAVVGGEYDVGISNTGGAEERIGMQVIASPPQNGSPGDGGKRGATLDAAYIAGASVTAAPWANGWYWYANAFDSSSNIIFGAATDANNGVNFSNVTFSGCAFKSNNFCVDQRGDVGINTLDAKTAIAIGLGPSERPINGQILQIHGAKNANSVFSADFGGMFWNTLNDNDSAWEPLAINASTLTLETASKAAVAIDGSQGITLGGTLGLVQSTWTSTKTCTAGQISVDANYIYVCTSKNIVKRVALSEF